ncbi:MAG: DUF58 domain-containing protein [Undibacterium sp.]|nr:DUF58 domain-containing protein [Undibacterium sp.]
MLTRLKTLFKQQIRKIIFLEKAPEHGEIILKQRRVFTLPNKAGLLFVVLLLIIFLTSVNYNLNLGFGMTYLLIGVAIVNMIFTFRNLAYLRLHASAPSPVFAGETLHFPIHLKNTQSLARYAIQIVFMEKDQVEHVIDIAARDSVTLKLPYPSQKRGYVQAPRIRLQTSFPLGILRAWSTWLPAAPALVYPHPEISPPPLPTVGDGQNEGLRSIGEEDFSGVRNYQTGDPLKALSWKHIARVDLDAGGSLISKQFSGGAAGRIAIDFKALPQHLDLELRLSRMTSWVLEADSRGLAYSFSLGNFKLTSAATEAHRLACLSALATFQLNAHE